MCLFLLLFCYYLPQTSLINTEGNIHLTAFTFTLRPEKFSMTVEILKINWIQQQFPCGVQRLFIHSHNCICGIHFSGNSSNQSQWGSSFCSLDIPVIGSLVLCYVIISLLLKVVDFKGIVSKIEHFFLRVPRQGHLLGHFISGTQNKQYFSIVCKPIFT